MQSILRTNPRSMVWGLWARSASTVAAPKVVFCAEHCNYPSPEKIQSKGYGEDALFVSPTALGVADGVGGWASSGVDPMRYPVKLMRHALEASRPPADKGAAAPTPNPLITLQQAYAHCNGTLGSSTASLATAAENGGVEVVNVGDSEVVAFSLSNSDSCEKIKTLSSSVRNVAGIRVAAESDGKPAWVPIFRSEVQQHYFNCPLQLGAQSEDRPHHGQQVALPIAPGDLVLIGSDGLFDNIFMETITAFLNAHVSSAGQELLAAVQAGDEAAARKANEVCRKELSSIVNGLAGVAQQVGASETARTPFAVGAIAAGYQYQGGKLDDVGLVLAYLLPDTPLARSLQTEYSTPVPEAASAANQR